MLSEQHNTRHIKSWLEWWRQQINSKYVPREIVTDMALALQSAISLTYNRLTYQEYLEACFRYIKKESTILPLCWIRIDISHLIVDVARWPCLKGKERRACKEFYVRCIGYLSTLESLEKITQVVKYTLLIATARYDKEDSNVKIGRNYLLNVFQGTYDHKASIKDVYRGNNIKNDVKNS